MSVDTGPTSGAPARGGGSEHAGALLSIDLAAIAANYRLLGARLGRVQCAAVVKADAYGLGAAHVAPVLAGAGCTEFFVAHLDEAAALRPHLPAGATIYVLHGAMPGAERDCAELGLVPVLNSPVQLDAWRRCARTLGRTLPGVLQVDTGMSRLGLSPQDLDAVVADGSRLQGIELRMVMSHLACAEQQAHPMNARQLAGFRSALQRLTAPRASLANSSGIFLGADFHFDLARPGAALWGVAPVAGQANPMRQVVRLQGRVIQVRTIESGASVGYGARYEARGERRIATVAVGYADGLLRSLSNRGVMHLDEQVAPIVGVVSMDTVTVDVTDLDPAALARAGMLDVIGPHHTVDTLAAEAGTIGYEILTSLGSRYHRRYLPA